LSSGFQLENESDKNLELVVVSVELITLAGITLASLIEIIKDKTISKGGDIAILYTALKNKNLTFVNFKEYDNYIFKLISHTAYDVLRDSFPRLIHSQLCKSIVGVKYEINLTNLNDFIIYKKDLTI
jgi:hypothetical protein